MLQHNFYHIVTKDLTPTSARAVITLNAAHRIFDGHFPGQPVVPGVCMMQIVREFVEQGVGAPLQITTADNMKFLSILNPTEHGEVVVTASYTLNDGRYTVDGSLSAGTVTFFKFKGTLSPAA
jgi:3-hydroxyacyl-[acyl-carrier-protein] dehydratase